MKDLIGNRQRRMAYGIFRFPDNLYFEMFASKPNMPLNLQLAKYINTYIIIHYETVGIHGIEPG